MILRTQGKVFLRTHETKMVLIEMRNRKGGCGFRESRVSLGVRVFTRPECVEAMARGGVIAADHFTVVASLTQIEIALMGRRGTPAAGTVSWVRDEARIEHESESLRPAPPSSQSSAGWVARARSSSWRAWATRSGVKELLWPTRASPSRISAP